MPSEVGGLCQATVRRTRAISESLRFRVRRGRADLPCGLASFRFVNVSYYRGLFDDGGRLMAIFCHNTDLGDGWEHTDHEAPNPR